MQIGVEVTAAPAREVVLDEALLARLTQLLADARSRGLVVGELTASDVLRIPQLLDIRLKNADQGTATPPPGVAALLDAVVTEALDALVVMRATEGRFIQADLDAKLATLGGFVDDLERIGRDGQQQLEARLRERLADLPPDIQGDPAAVAQETVRFVARSDVDEEIVRMRGPRRTLARARGRARAVRPQARFPGPGDESRDQHDRLEGGGRPRHRDRDRRQGRARAAPGASAECRVDAAAAALLFVVSAPSGTGKTTVVERLVEICPNLQRSRSYTSRPARPGESDGVDYNFISRPAFEGMVARGEFLEWADVFGNLYGTARRDTEASLAAGRDVVLVIDVQGARQVRERTEGAVGIFVLPPSFEALETRLRGRCQDEPSGHRAAARHRAQRSVGGDRVRIRRRERRARPLRGGAGRDRDRRTRAPGPAGAED